MRRLLASLLHSGSLAERAVANVQGDLVDLERALASVDALAIAAGCPHRVRTRGMIVRTETARREPRVGAAIRA